MLSYVDARVMRPLQQNQALLILCATTVVVMMGQGIISPVLPLYAKSFGVATTLVGLTISVFGAARLVMNLPAGFLSERFGRRLLMVGGPAITALGSVLSGLAPDLWWLLGFRFLAGVGSALYMTGAMILLTDVTTEENRGRIMSLYQGSLLLGVSIGPAVGGGVAELFGLRSPFYLVAGLAALATVWSFRHMPETQERTKDEPLAASKAAPAEPKAAGTMKSLLLNPGFILVSLLSMTIFLERTGARLTIVPLVGEDRLGMSPGTLGIIFTMMTILNLATLAPAGTMVDKLGRKAVIVPSAVVTAGALLLFAVSDSTWLFMLAAFIHGLGTGIVGPAPAAYAADIAPPALRGVTIGLFRTFSDAGFVIGPVLLGWVADAASFGWALSVSAMLMFGFAMLFALFARETLVRKVAVSEPAMEVG